MALPYNLPERDMDIRATVTLTTGTAVSLGASDIRSYTLDEQSASSGFSLGEAQAASFELGIDDADRARTVLELEGAKVEMRVGLWTGTEYAYSDMGAWYIDSVYRSMQSSTMTLKGEDALATRFDTEWSDSLKYPVTLGSLASAVCAKAGIALKSADFFNSGASVPKKPEFPEGTTLRGVIANIAACAGGFARIDRSGALEFVTYNRQTALGTVTADTFSKLETGDGSHFSFNCLGVRYEGDDDYTRYTVADKADTALNTLQVSENPLYTKAIANSVKTALTGFYADGVNIRWKGDPGVMPGDVILVEDTDGQVKTLVVNRQNLIFDGGLTATTYANLPSETSSSSGYTVNEGALTAAGMLNGGKLVVGSVSAEKIAAEAITAEKIAAGSITTDKLDAGSVTADKIAAGSVTAEKLESESVSAKVAQFVAAEIEKITAGDISTNTLYAAFAHVMELAAGSIQAGNIQTDQLAAALANIVSLHVSTGDFDLATVSNLLSNALVLQQGVADSMMITNLSVTRANLLSAILGDLVVKGSDGNYYRIVVGADGGISTEPAQVTAGEISAGQTSGGQSIVETNLAVGDLDAQNIRAASAIVNELLVQSLNAGKITAGDALLASATIPSLYTTAIQAIGDGMDLSANDTIRLLLGAKDEMQRWFTFDNERGLLIQKPAYTDANGVEHPASIWRTITDETGYHIQRTDLPGYVASFARDRLIVDGAQIGDIVARKTASGGWAWVDA